MTIQELYDWAKKNNCLDYQIIVDCDYDVYTRKTSNASFSNKIDWAKEVEI